MHIIGFGCNQVPPVKYLHFDCDERVNLFVGPNASGKTTILRAIKGSYSESRENTPVSGGIEFTNSLGNNAYFYMEASDDWPRDPSIAYPYNSEAVIWDSVPLLYIPATRINLPVQDIFGKWTDGSEDYDTDAPLKNLFETDSGIFYGTYVQKIIDIYGPRMASDRRRGTALRRAVEVGYSCAKDICREVIHDDVPHTFVEIVESDDDEPQVTRVSHYGMGIGTNDNIIGEPLYAGVLSSGTQGTLLWIWALALKMANHYGWTEGWEEKPAILLIDEIDNHLHPDLATPRNTVAAQAFSRPPNICYHPLALRRSRPASRAGAPAKAGRERRRHGHDQHRKRHRLDGRRNPPHDVGGGRPNGRPDGCCRPRAAPTTQRGAERYGKRRGAAPTANR